MAIGAAPPIEKITPALYQGGEYQTPKGPQPDARVEMFKAIFREEWEKPFWQNLRLNTATDFGYYNGPGQWSEEARAQMRQHKKPALVLNHIKPTCNVLFGLERMNRYEPKAAPEGNEDVQVADIFTRLLRRVMYDTDGEFILSDGFEDGTICGVVAFELPIFYDEDPVHGKIGFKTVRVPDDLIWSTPWREYDLSDCRAVFRHRWIDIDLLLSRYPNHKKAITEALGSAFKMTPADASQVGAILHEGDPKDAYAGTDGIRPEEDRSFWFDEEHNRVRVLEVYYPEYYPTWILASSDGKRVIQSTDELKMRRVFQKLVERAGGFTGFKLLQRNVKKIHMLVCLPVSNHVLEEGQPFEKDPYCYPFIPYFAVLKRDDIYGVVRDLRDPQDEINARRSQIAWLTKATGDGWFVDEGSMVDVKVFEEQSRDPKGVYVVKPNKSDPRRMPPPTLPQGLFEILRLAVNEVRQISGVNSELTGVGAEDRSLSGVAMERRKQQGQVITTGLFDNFKRTKRLIWQKMAKRIQEVYTEEQVVRLLNSETGADEFVTINQVVPDGASAPGMPPVPGAAAPSPGMPPVPGPGGGLDAGVPGEGPATLPGQSPTPGQRFKVLNDVSTLKYDIVMAETPASPTARQAALATMLELIQKVPAIAPLIVDVIFEMTEGLPNRDAVLKRVKQFVADQTARPQGPPPPKVSVVLRGDIDPYTAKDLADDAQINTSTAPLGPGGKMGADAGNSQNPSGQLPTGGENLQNRSDLPPIGP